MTKKSKYDMPPVQNFAFGGIANPSQRAFLRSSDKSYLDARQKELDAFEQQRLAYNDSLTKWQTDVYNPYKAQVDAYNTASEKYNTDVYNPYKAQVDAYNAAAEKYNTDVYNPYKTRVEEYNAAAEKYNTDVYNPYKTDFQKYQEAVDAWNAGDRTTDYAGPAEPKLASEFTMTSPGEPAAFGMAAPTTPKAFEMAAPTAPEQFKGVAPVLPFKEEEVVARQQEAANRARQDAGQRAVAIDVVSNPDQFNFGSMSVSNRFMAKGGEVMQDDPHDKTASSIIRDFEKYGYTKDEIMALADDVAAKGRGGDELLAYLSPESVEYLKANGGSGTINPMTGLPEFKGGVLGSIGRSIKRVFGGGGGSAAPAVEPADAPTEAPASLPSRNRNVRLDAETSEIQNPQPVLQRRTTAAQDLQAVTPTPTPPPAAVTPPPAAVTPPPAAVTPPPAAVTPPVASTPTPPTLTPAAPATTPGTAADMLKKVTTTPSPPSGSIVPPESQYGVPTSSDGKWLYSGDKWWPNEKMTISPVTAPVTAPATTPGTAADMFKNVTAASPSNNPMSPNFVGPRSPSEEAAFKAQGAGIINPQPQTNPNQALAQTVLQMAVGRIDKDMKYDVNNDGKLNSADALSISRNGMPAPAKPTLNTAIDQLKAGNKDEATNTLRQIVGLDPIPLKPKTQITAPGLVGGTVGSRTVIGGPVGSQPITGGPVGSVPIQAPSISFDPVKGAAPLPKVDLRGRGGFPVTGRPGGGGSRTTPQAPGNSAGGDIPIYAPPPLPDYSSRGVGSVGPIGGGGNIPIYTPPAMPTGPMFGNPNMRIGGAGTNNNSYFGLSPQNSTGLAPGSAAIGPADMPIAAGRNTLNAIGANPNLSPTMLGGQQNAGVMRDRLGNQIYSPGMGLFGPPGFAKGGGVDVNALMAQNTETLSDETPEDVINTDPVGTAQKMLADLNSLGKASPTRQSIKRTKTSGGGASSEKAMQMAYEDIAKGDLGAMKDRPPAMKNTESARAQMEELARVYQMKIRAAQNAARGLAADTFGAPSLEQPTLTKGSLTKKRFKDGGEAKKDSAESAKEPGIFSVNSYATDASARMFPDQMGQDDQRDAVRHMLAAAAMSKKFGPGTAEFLGKAHERLSNPESFFSMFGIGKPRDDYEMDVHNNKLGAELGARTTSQAELEKLVRAMAMQAQNKQVEGKPWTMSKEQMKNRKGQITTAPPEYRAEGSPPEGELSQEEIDAASKPAFVTPKSGKGRKQGEISKQLKSGDAYINMAKGVTELPYDIAGAPVDLATMMMRPFGYSTEKPVMGSDFIKEKMTKAGVRPEPPADPTAKGFYTAGELLSNLTNPAGVTRSAVKGAQKTAEAATDVAKDFQEYNRQLAVPGASYAVRPTGSTMLSGPVGMKEDVSGIDKLLSSGVANATRIADRNEGQANILRDFWDKKARNYFTRQFGTPDDPIARGIANKQIKGSALEEDFPEYMIDQINMGKTRVKEGVRPEGFVGPGTPESRFFPKYPRAMDDFTKRYDAATNLKGVVLTSDPAAVNSQYGNILSEQGKQLGRTAQVAEEDKMLTQGLRPELINANVEAVGRSLLDSDKIAGYATSSAEDLFKAYKEASLMNKMDKPQKTNWINQLFGEGRKVMGKTEDEVVKNMLSENIMTAINKGEPVYDMQYGLQKPLQAVFDPISINKYLASIPPREAANIRFEDAVKGGLKMREQLDQRAMLVDRIKSGKPVADAVFSKGVSAPLLQFDEGPLKGFAWKRIEKREATIPEGAYVGHSVGGYETGGIGYPSEKMEGFNTGKYQVYTLRDNRNRPVNTIEVTMVDEFTPVVTQIKGNGRASGNVPAEKYDSAVLRFLQDYLRPAAVQEKDELLTPLLKTYKEGVNSTFKMP